MNNIINYVCKCVIALATDNNKYVCHSKNPTKLQFLKQIRRKTKMNGIVNFMSLNIYSSLFNFPYSTENMLQLIGSSHSSYSKILFCSNAENTIQFNYPNIHFLWLKEMHIPTPSTLKIHCEKFQSFFVVIIAGFIFLAFQR